MRTLFTGRLVLSAVTSGDLDDLFALCAMPEVNVFNPAGSDTHKEQSHQRLNAWLQDWHEHGMGYYTARDAVTGAYVGYIGVALRTFNGERLLNLAYRIRPEFQGKGVVTEACTEILNAARLTHSGSRVRVLTKENNQPSIAVAGRLGFTYDPTLDGIPDPGDVNFFLTL